MQLGDDNEGDEGGEGEPGEREGRGMGIERQSLALPGGRGGEGRGRDWGPWRVVSSIGELNVIDDMGLMHSPRSHVILCVPISGNGHHCTAFKRVTQTRYASPIALVNAWLGEPFLQHIFTQ